MKTLLLLLTMSIISSCSNGTEPVENTPVASLGEGAIWHSEKEALMWVDITEGRVFMYRPGEGMVHDIELESMVGTVVPAARDYLAVAAQETGITGLREDGTTEMLTGFPSDAEDNVRFNDGKCDPRGRLWVGTMHKQARKGAGKLYMLQDDSLHIKESDVTISNGIVWDTDLNVMYYIDTPEQCVYAYDYEPETGKISNRRVAIEIPEDTGSPDGMSIDSEGKLWIAHWGGHGVYRWDPASGELLEKIDVPAPNVTSCAFGGDDLKTLYITTARQGLDDEQLEEYPLSGSLFVTKTNVKGTKSYEFDNDLATP
ncbi:MAG: SMP-30/gluconolactonase/LRE family protein [Marinilabilia sp.]